MMERGWRQDDGKRKGRKKRGETEKNRQILSGNCNL